MADELVDAFDRASADDASRPSWSPAAAGRSAPAWTCPPTATSSGSRRPSSPTLEDLHLRLEDPEIVTGVRDTGGRVSLAIYRCTKPVIGAMNGAAVGIGATMTLPMDVRLASDVARIGFVFGRLGIVPEAASSWFLPRIVGISRALEWVYTADILSADAHGEHPWSFSRPATRTRCSMRNLGGLRKH